MTELMMKVKNPLQHRKHISSRLFELADDLRQFSERLKDVAELGYRSHIDDGAALNAAPLRELLPSWPKTRKAWQELEAGRYDWAGQAMDYWPDRVTKSCRSNRSLAIAHGLEQARAEAAPSVARRTKRKTVNPPRERP